MRVGIARGLYYYRYFPFWQAFFQGLGLKVVVSDPTTKQILDFGQAAAVDGICLPVKVFIGHVQNLIEKNIDLLFIPYIISVEKAEYICPKFMGLPDIVASSIPQLPPMLSPTIDGRRGSLRIMRTYLNLGLRFAPLPKVLRAYYDGIYQQHEYEHNQIIKECRSEDKLQIGILGHEYLIHDEFVSMGIKKRLEQAGCITVAVENLDAETLKANSSFLKKRMFWTSGKRILGAANYFATRVDGIVSLMSFACGTDSFTIDLVERYCRRSQIPHLLISLDEHTGQAGVVTRIDAFVDLLQRRKNRENHCSAHG